jgi:hypothetical protein
MTWNTWAHERIYFTVLFSSEVEVGLVPMDWSSSWAVLWAVQLLWAVDAGLGVLVVPTDIPCSVDSFLL